MQPGRLRRLIYEIDVQPLLNQRNWVFHFGQLCGSTGVVVYDVQTEFNLAAEEASGLLAVQTD